MSVTDKKWLDVGDDSGSRYVRVRVRVRVTAETCAL